MKPFWLKFLGVFCGCLLLSVFDLSKADIYEGFLSLSPNIPLHSGGNNDRAWFLNLPLFQTREICDNGSSHFTFFFFCWVQSNCLLKPLARNFHYSFPIGNGDKSFLIFEKLVNDQLSLQWFQHYVEKVDLICIIINLKIIRRISLIRSYFTIQ